jgi:N utilization substance protein A
MDLKQIISAVEQIAEERGITKEKVFSAIENAIGAAYKKEYRKKSEIIKAKFDPKTGYMSFYQVKIVVDGAKIAKEGKEEDENTKESPLIHFNPDRHILLEEAKKIKPDVMPGEEMEFPLEERQDFGRIAAQTAKQVILQSIREAERDSIKEEFSDKEGEIVSGQIQRFEKGNILVNLGRAIGIMYSNESIPGEHYKSGDRMRFYILAVQDDSKGPGVILSRANPNFIVKLFELEVPEIADKIVVIKNIAREPGLRTKIAVYSNDPSIDAVGATVGQRGTRVMAVTNELGNEKIDVVEWSDDPQKFITNALSPAKIKMIEILPKREAKVIVAEDQLSLAIGRGGQNVRLAAKLTGWKIDVRSQSNPETIQEGGIASAEETAPIIKKVDDEEEDNPKIDTNKI